ncbi:hypothetical protein GC173_11365 [bacterium]|nr:hypothetical protein [bacterium]
MRDIRFTRFDWHRGPDGDLGRVDDLAAMREIINRWLLTEPATDGPELVASEVEDRRAYASAEERAAEYSAPGGAKLLACLPWAPTWGAGIKRYLGRQITTALTMELRARVRSGLAKLDGVTRVVAVEVSSSDSSLAISWRVQTAFGAIGDLTRIEV